MNVTNEFNLILDSRSILFDVQFETIGTGRLANKKVLFPGIRI